MEERLIWAGRPVVRDIFLNPLYYILVAFTAGFGIIIPLWVVLKRITTHYRITDQRLVVEYGIIAKHVDDLELYRIKDTKADQSAMERLLRIGVVATRTTDGSSEFTIEKITKPRQVRELLRTATEQLKQSRNVRILTE